MNSKIENDSLFLNLEGRVDTSNVDGVEAEMNALIEANPGLKLVIDADNLQYISSAGLRVMLRLRKSHPDMKIINVSNEVYDIFEMTGFTDMITIEKGYRKVSIDGCEVLGEGSNGIVYRLEDDIIIKVYKNNDALADIHRERELARAALVMGVNTAIPYDVVKVGDQYGSVFELLSAKSIGKLILDDPDNIDKYIDIFVNFLKDIHSCTSDSPLLPSEKQIVMKWVTDIEGKIDDAHYQKLYKLVDGVPEDNHLLHGDYHPGNLHYTGGEAIIIDMDTLAVGNPIFEFGSVFNAFKGFGLIDKKIVEKFQKVNYETACYIWEEMVKRYWNVTDITEIENRSKVVGLTRLLRRTYRREPDNKEYLEVCEKELLAAIDATDSLI